MLELRYSEWKMNSNKTMRKCREKKCMKAKRSYDEVCSNIKNYMAKQVNAIYIKYRIVFFLVKRWTKEHFVVLNVSGIEKPIDNVLSSWELWANNIFLLLSFYSFIYLEVLMKSGFHVRCSFLVNIFFLLKWLKIIQENSSLHIKQRH